MEGSYDLREDALKKELEKVFLSWKKFGFNFSCKLQSNG